jgi:hypothetical protein
MRRHTANCQSITSSSTSHTFHRRLLGSRSDKSLKQMSKDVISLFSNCLLRHMMVIHVRIDRPAGRRSDGSGWDTETDFSHIMKWMRLQCRMRRLICKRVTEKVMTVRGSHQNKKDMRVDLAWDGPRRLGAPERARHAFSCSVTSVNLFP